MAMADELKEISRTNENKIIQRKKDEQARQKKDFNDKLEELYKDITNQAKYKAENGERKACITIIHEINYKLESALGERLRDQDGFIVYFREYRENGMRKILEIEW